MRAGPRDVGCDGQVRSFLGRQQRAGKARELLSEQARKGQELPSIITTLDRKHIPLAKMNAKRLRSGRSGSMSHGSGSKKLALWPAGPLRGQSRPLSVLNTSFHPLHPGRCSENEISDRSRPCGLGFLIAYRLPSSFCFTGQRSERRNSGAWRHFTKSFAFLLSWSRLLQGLLL